MKAILPATPDDETLAALLGDQEEVERQTDYPSKVNKAGELWDTRCNNAVFARLRGVLLQMCTEEQCMYCERSVANQLEHFQPKAFYPEVVFSWANYLFICNPCNINKSNRFAVFSFVSG
jgi:5-methylcytosine-specific restriction endonuclease McrA